MKIAIDIGHADGTGSRGNGEEEHDLANKVGIPLALELQRLGHDVRVIDFPYLSNTGDFIAAVKAANAYGADLFVSLHCDCSDNASAHGGHVIHHPMSKQGRKLALAIAKPLCRLMPGRAKQTDQGTFYVIRETDMPAVIVEMGFISNKKDIAMLRQSDVLAAAIARGIYNYTQSTN